MKHTKGKWELTKDFNIKCGNTLIARVWKFHGQEGNYNARLIASAPDMLEALINIFTQRIKSCDSPFKCKYSCDTKRVNCFIPTYKNIIESATGKTIDEVLKES